MGVKVIKPPTVDTTVANSFIQRPLHSKDTLLVGRKKCTYRALLQFDLSTLPFLLNVLAGNFQVYLSVNSSLGLAKTISLHQILSPWDGKPCGFDNIAYDPIPAAAITITNEQETFLNFDITTLLRDWHSGVKPNLGMLLRMQNEYSFYYVELVSRDADNSTLWPSLSIQYIDPVPPGGGCCVPLDAEFTVTSSDTKQSTATLNIQMFTYTYFIINLGLNPADISLEISPDGTTWLIDQPQHTIVPGTMLPVVPNILGKYARLTYQSANPGSSTIINVQVRGRS